MFRIGILGAGGIASKMAETILAMDGFEVLAVGSRDVKKAEEFAEKYKISVAYGSYEELVSDENIDLIYVATPHSHHFEHCMLCLEHNKNILCEKSFTVNFTQASRIFNLAKEKNLFVCEAMWTRFMPSREILDGILQSGTIGEISALTANLGYSISHVERLKKPELAGGALLDLGVYTLNFADMVFGTSGIKAVKSSCTKNEFGVDLHNSILLEYSDGKSAMLHSNMDTLTDRRGIIYGSLGRVEVENINNIELITVIKTDGTSQKFEIPPQINGFEYQVLEAKRAITAGEIESPKAKHSETLAILKIMDNLREDWGVKFPFE